VEHPRLDHQKRKAGRRAELEALERAQDDESERVKRANKAVRTQRAAAKQVADEEWAKKAADPEARRKAWCEKVRRARGSYVAPEGLPADALDLRQEMEMWWNEQEERGLQDKRHLRSRWLTRRFGEAEAKRRIAAIEEQLNRVRTERANCEARWRERDAKVEARHAAMGRQEQVGHRPHSRQPADGWSCE
jgi:hypothetical protein